MTEKPVDLHIIVGEPELMGEEVRQRLASIGTVCYGPYDDRQSLIEAVAGAHVLMVRLGHQIDREIINAAPHLKMIISATTGLNHIDLDACKKRSIEIICLRGEREFLNQISSTAELSFALLMGLARKITSANDAVKGGKWERDCFFGSSLSGMTLGIIGLGRLGYLMAGYANAFAMNVIWYDRANVTDVPDDARSVSLDELLTSADVVAIHASHYPGEPPILGPRELAMVKPSAFIINTARGELVDEEALVQALEGGRIGGYATDVLNGEQKVKEIGQHPLVQLARRSENIVLTPHIGGATENGLYKAEIFVVEKAIAELELLGYLSS
jgi:D-3-phosphoglycerate dehydrogenase / 2-oxoglutarate reductase